MCCLTLERTEPVGWGKQVARPETDSADVSPPSSPIYTLPSLLDFGPEATWFRQQDILPTEQSQTSQLNTAEDIGSKVLLDYSFFFAADSLLLFVINIIKWKEAVL